MSPTTIARPSVGAVFEETAARYAERTAVCAPEGDISYGELDARANQIASAVQALDAVSTQHVALLFDQGADAIAATFGVLKAGRIYVALDPADPPSRLRYVARDSLANLILTDSRHARLARKLAGDDGAVIEVDQIGLDCCPRHGNSDVAPPGIAYLLYTSGSTGQPKGVLHSHRNLLHFTRSYQNRLEITADDRMSLLYSLSVTGSHTDIYGALLSGAALCPYQTRLRGVAHLADWIREQRITIWHTVPTLFRHVLRHLNDPACLSTVRAVDLGGEPMYGSDVRLFRSSFRRGTLFVNHYGATEGSLLAQCTVSDLRGPFDGILPVGPQAPGIEVRIAREDGSEADVDETGEVVVHSPFVSPGYWRRDELTASTFDQDPQRSGWRIYRTGDLGRLDAQRNLYIIGRKDARVKIRGHSVEISEVEAAIRNLAPVRDAAVVALPADDHPEEGTRLIAHVVAKHADAHELHRLLARGLPRYMWPARINVLDVLPLTSAGKIDRRALNAADPGVPPTAHVGDPPADDVEQFVSAIFRRMLNVPSVGCRDHFFDLGGHSLKLAELQVELGRTFGHEPPLSALLREPTVAGVAALIRSAADACGRPVASSVLVPLRESGSRPRLFIVHGQLGQAYASPALLHRLGDDQPVYAFQARGLDGRQTPRTRITRMADDYIDSMRQVQPQGPYCLAGLCAGGIIAHEMARRLQATGESLALLLMIDPPYPPSQRDWKSRQRDLRLARQARRPVASPEARKLHDRILDRLRLRAERGRGLAVPDDPARQDAAVRVALDLRIAFIRHRIRTCTGPVHVLGSRARLTGDAWQAGIWPRHIRGDIRLIEVGLDHQDVIDPANDRLAAAITRCIDESTSANRDVNGDVLRPQTPAPLSSVSSTTCAPRSTTW